MTKFIPTAYDLARISQSELNEIIGKHKDFLDGRRGGIRANLQFLDLAHLDFEGKDLSQADFTGSSLSGANMAGAVLKSACFFACDLHNALMVGADLTRTDLRGAHISGANMRGANLENADLREGKVMERDEHGAMIDRERLGIQDDNFKWSTVLSGARMADTNLTGIKAKAADFSDADLSHAIVQRSELQHVNFEGANLTDTDFTGADMVEANLQESIMTGTVLESANLRGAEIDNVIDDSTYEMTFEEIGVNIEDLLDRHRIWIETHGDDGERMDMSNIDMRDILALRKYSLTAIKAENANFMGQDLFRVEMQYALLDVSDFRDCKLMKADLRGSSFKHGKFSRANMEGSLLCPLLMKDKNGKETMYRSNFSGALMRYVNLRDSDLRNAILMGTDLSHASLAGCDLRKADLTGANLNDADLAGANLDGAIMD